MCTPGEIQRYAGRVSGPLLDRIDIHVEVPRVGFGELSGVAPGEASSVVRERVQRARVLREGLVSYEQNVERTMKATIGADLRAQAEAKVAQAQKPADAGSGD